MTSSATPKDLSNYLIIKYLGKAFNRKDIECHKDAYDAIDSLVSDMDTPTPYGLADCHVINQRMNTRGAIVNIKPTYPIAETMIELSDADVGYANTMLVSDMYLDGADSLFLCAWTLSNTLSTLKEQHAQVRDALSPYVGSWMQLGHFSIVGGSVMVPQYKRILGAVALNIKKRNA